MNKCKSRVQSIGSVPVTHRSMSSNSSSTFNNFNSKQNYDTLTPKQNKDQNTFFSTDTKISEYVIKQLYQDNKISKNMVKTTLNSFQDLPTFISGNKKISNDGEANLRLFQFDACLNENQHSKLQIQTGNHYLRQWFIGNHDQDQETLNFCFLFGSGATQKSEEMNFLGSDSLIQKFLKEISDPIRLLRVTMFFQNQEFILNHRIFKSNKKSQRELGMQIREALRDKRRLIQKLSKKKPELAFIIQHCSHFRIQINNYVFIDLADLSGLQMTKNQEIVQTLTNDFGSMTNEILRQSKFYLNHEFLNNKQQKESAFNNFLQEKLTFKSNVLMYAYITNDENDFVNSSITLDFAHKIRSFCSGRLDECLTPQFAVETTRIPQLQDAFSRLAQVYEQISKIETRINRQAKNMTKVNEYKSNANNLNQVLKKIRQFTHQILNSKPIYNTFQVEMDRLFTIQTFIEQKLTKAQNSINEMNRPKKSNNFEISDTLQDELKNQIINITKVNKNHGNDLKKNTDSLIRRNNMLELKSFTIGQNQSQKDLQVQVRKNNIKSLDVNRSQNENNRPMSVQMNQSRQFNLNSSKDNSLMVNVKGIKKSRSKVMEMTNKKYPKLTSQVHDTKSQSSGGQRFRRISNNNRKLSNENYRNGKVAVRKIIKKVNKDIPINVEDELNDEIEKSLNLLKTQKGIKVSDPRETTDMSYLMSDTKMSRISLKEDLTVLEYGELNSIKPRSRKASRSRSGGGRVKKIKSLRIVPQTIGVESVENLFTFDEAKNSSYHFEIEQELYEKTQHNKELIFQVEMLQKQLENQRTEAKTITHQQLSFNKNEYDTQIGIQELEIKNQKEQISHLKRENQKSVKTLEKMLKVQNYTKNLQSETVDNNKKYQELIEKLSLENDHIKRKYQDQIQILTNEAKNQKEQNQIILNQVKIMKEAINDSRDCEIMNKELLSKNKEKSDKIHLMKQTEKVLLDQMKENQKYIDKLKDKFIHLEIQNNDRSEIDELSLKYKSLKSKYNNMIRKDESECDLKEINNDFIDRIKDLKAEIVIITLARDKFRSLSLDQKNEIRKLKNKYQESSNILRLDQSDLNTSFQDEELNTMTLKIKETAKSISQKENIQIHNSVPWLPNEMRSVKKTDSNSLMMKHYDSAKTTANKKEKAISDIRSLIQDYKKDKLLTTQQK